MNITITDDDAIVVMSLKTILETTGEVQVLATGQNGQEAVQIFEKFRPEITLIDIQMPIMDGLAAAEAILKKDPSAKVLFLTTFTHNDYIVKALNIGAKGYILKQDFANILPALRAVHAGQSVFGNDIVSKLTHLMQEEGSDFEYAHHGITPKEEEIIDLVADGLNNQEISDQLHLSAGTIRNYISTILEKLDLRDRTQLVVFHYQNKG